MSLSFHSLESLREKFFGVSVAAVARSVGLTPEELRTFESRDDIGVHELELLASVYGIDSVDLADLPITFGNDEGITALANLDEFRDIDDIARLRIIKAAKAAADLGTLRALVVGDEPHALDTLRESLPSMTVDASRKPYEQGADLASFMRSHLGLGDGPIPSLADLVDDVFPELSILHADLTSRGPAGLCLTDRRRGPTIILNTRGKNENPLVMRFSLAHELCHLLVDWSAGRPLIELSGFLKESDLPLEQRANSFAVRFLCPESVVHTLDSSIDPYAAMKHLLEYGLPYAAIRLYLENETSIELPVHPPYRFASSMDGLEWRRSERLSFFDSYPLEEVPTERRTVIAHLAARCYSDGLITRSALADYLGVKPTCELERVLDLFDLPEPLSGEAASS